MLQAKRILLFTFPILLSALLIGVVMQSGHAEDTADASNNDVSSDDLFPTGYKYLLPPLSPLLSDPGRDAETERVAYGAVSDELLEQPIAYSHKLHAGTLKIECEYCHSGARRSIHAGVPATQVCMNCHKLVDSTDRPELEKLKKYFADGEVIPWKKVHDLPDFVYFSHKRHVRGGLACQECHGEVQDEMEAAYRVSELTMGWCLDCHENHPAVDENYGAQAELRRTELKDCWTCHK